MEKIRKVLDYRRSYVKQTHELGRAQMVRYFQARYSWGQPCDPRRANDWGTLCAYLRDCQEKGLFADFRRSWVWPSGNKGSISGMLGIYHDGYELLADLGLVDELDFV
jgi:hypothetical protein